MHPSPPKIVYEPSMSHSDQDLSARANRKVEDVEAYPTLPTPVQVVNAQATNDTAGSRSGLNRRISVRLEDLKRMGWTCSSWERLRSKSSTVSISDSDNYLPYLWQHIHVLCVL